MIENLNEDELLDIQETINELIDNYLEENSIYIFNPDFNDEMNQTISEIIYHDFQYIFENESMEDGELYDSIEDLVDKSIENYFVYSRIPKRSNSITFEDENEKVEILKDKIAFLKEQEQPEQKTKEWYQFRYNLITASNLWKVFGTESQVNSLIYEKCKPLQEISHDSLQSGPLFWGIKYEPVTVMIYEDMFHTKVDDFGCIKHEKYPFIGASPDGINVDETNIRFGRMIEIKNIYNREITGIPKKEYWIQMQLQMEVCDLNECDFLETKFTEYSDYDDFINDNTTNYKGIILQYLKNEEPYYIYAPFMLNDVYSNEYKNWFNEKIEQNKEFTFINTLYWKLEIISCVLVLRNKYWFNTILPYIETFWNQLVSERESGLYKERISKKRKLKLEDEKSRSDFPNSGCLINI